MSVTSFIVKMMFTRGDRKRDKDLVPPESISTISDIHYGSDKKWQLLDIHHPKDFRQNYQQLSIFMVEPGSMAIKRFTLSIV